MTRCLGLPAAPTIDVRTLCASRYFTSALPEPPPSLSLSAGMPDDLGMLGNDEVGDCAEAMVLHGIEVDRFRNGAPVTFDTSAAKAFYSDVTGWNPADPTTDQGTDLLALMRYMVRTGFAGHTYGAFVSLLVGGTFVNVDTIKLALDLFGPLKLGAKLHASAEADFDAGRPWSDATGPVIGRHAILLVDYDADGVVVVTWGQRQRATWAWVGARVDEAFADVSPDWVSGAKPAPTGFALAALQADLAQIGAAA